MPCDQKPHDAHTLIFLASPVAGMCHRTFVWNEHQLHSNKQQSHTRTRMHARTNANTHLVVAGFDPSPQQCLACRITEKHLAHTHHTTAHTTYHILPSDGECQVTQPWHFLQRGISPCLTATVFGKIGMEQRPYVEMQISQAGDCHMCT